MNFSAIPSAFVAWLQAPFSGTKISPWQWFQLVGLLIVILILWRMVLSHLLES